jgi:circadian clock protein KaiC
MEFLVRGATRYGEPGVFMAFEENAAELTQNVASLGFNLKDLMARKKLWLDYVHIERSEIELTGEYDLEALFIRLGHAIDAIGAKRVVLDTIEALFAGLPNPMILRAELRRLFRWLKDRGVTAVITAERGEGTLTRHGLEEYVSDCVILLDHRVNEQVSTRRLRVVKYRGSVHGTNEYPFLIDAEGLSVLPITSYGLQHGASSQRISSGIPRLDAMLGGKGYYRSSTVLVSGTAGSGKTTVAAQFADAACRRGERVLFAAYEESPDQIARNLRSIGIDFKEWMRRGLLQIQAQRPTHFGLETHLIAMHKAVRAFRPRVVVVDPINSFVGGASLQDVNAMLIRLIDFFKGNRISVLLTSLTPGNGAAEQSNVAISSLVDTWLLLRNLEQNGERNRTLFILKSRGMAHSNQIREFLLTGRGVELRDVYVGPGGVLTGSARAAQEAQEEAAQMERRQAIDGKRLDLERKRRAAEDQIAALRATVATEIAELAQVAGRERAANRRGTRARTSLARNRQAGR